MDRKVVIMDHPLIQHKLSILRDVDTSTMEFRELVNEIAMLMMYDATRDLPLEDKQVTTPCGVADCKVLAGRPRNLRRLHRPRRGRPLRAGPRHLALHPPGDHLRGSCEGAIGGWRDSGNPERSCLLHRGYDRGIEGLDRSGGCSRDRKKLFGGRWTESG